MIYKILNSNAAYIKFIIIFLLYVFNSYSNPVLIIIGTRPEAIKVFPICIELKKQNIPFILCSTGQHGDLLTPLYDVFGIKPDIDLNIMKPNQDLFYITTQVLTELKKVITTVNPSLVMIQGDTTTAMAAALAAFYLQKPIAHIEAGLRTNDIYNPFPEEINRRFISQIASYHFAPTQNAVDNLIKENMHKNIYRTGNTVVDALNIILNKIALNELTINQQIIDLVQQTKACNKQIVIITAHRRENVEHRLYHIFNALHQICLEFDQVQFIYPMHPNPKIKSIALNCQLFELKNMVITSALSYQEMVYLLSHCDLVITDSGGLQEEAISLEKPVVILRKKTERYEAIECGLGFLGGTKFNTIYSAFLKAFSKSKKDFNTLHIYGDGFASERIIKKIKKDFFS